MARVLERIKHWPVKVRRAWCSIVHRRRRVPTNGFMWTGTRCPTCGYIYFGQWDDGAHG